jgi:hypothetical protein
MAMVFPESVTRLQATVFVDGAEIKAINRNEIILHAAKNMAESALRKLLDDCIKTQDYQGYQGQTLCLDVCVIEPGELLRLLADARTSGQTDALRWGSFTVN